MRLVLASTSPFRQSLLKATGLPFEAIAPGVDESDTRRLNPKQVARLFARQKAEAVAERFPDALVIGSDQTPDLAGKLLRKPGSREEARKQLRALSGREHFLHTAVCVRRMEPRFSKLAVESVKLRLRKLSSKEIEAYLDTGEWEGCAGGYRIEAQGLKLLEAWRGDYHAIVGLPMVRTLSMLREAGLPMF